MKLINAKLNSIHSHVFYAARYSEEGIKNSVGNLILTYMEHHRWYSNQNMNDMYLIFHINYVGYVRIDLNRYISIAMCTGEYNKGYGTFALTELTQKYDNLKAKINVNNIPSIQLFKKFTKIKVEFQQNKGENNE